MSALINLVLSCCWFFFLSFFELHQFLRNCTQTKVHHLFIPGWLKVTQTSFVLLFEKKLLVRKNIKKHGYKVYKNNVFVLSSKHIGYVPMVSCTLWWPNVRWLRTKLALKMITVSTSKCAKSRSHEQTKIYNTIIRFI